MKEIRETKMVEQTTVKFVAFDGTEFDKDYDCRVYEAKKNSGILKAKLDGVLTEVKLHIMEWWNCSTVYKVKARNKEDILNIYAYVDDSYESFEYYEKSIPIGETIYMVVNEDGYANFYNFDLAKELKETYDELVGKPSKKSGKSEK